MNHPWWGLILALAAALDDASIPYSFDAATALFVQGVPVQNMDDIDISVQWDRFEDAYRLFEEHGPTPIRRHPGWAVFRFERGGVPIDILSYEGTVMASDPHRVCVTGGGRTLWAKSADFFLEALPVEHPRRQEILAHRSTDRS